MGAGQLGAVLVDEKIGEKARLACPSLDLMPAAFSGEMRLDTVPDHLIDDGRMLAVIRSARSPSTTG
jgi:hypothetical protein